MPISRVLTLCEDAQVSYPVIRSELRLRCGANTSHEKLMESIELRIADRRMLRLIRKWLKAGVSEDGQWSETKVGTPGGLRCDGEVNAVGGLGSVSRRSLTNACPNHEPYILTRWTGFTPGIPIRAVCVSSACTDLCGGRSTMAAPTATGRRPSRPASNGRSGDRPRVWTPALQAFSYFPRFTVAKNRQTQRGCVPST
jgi:hypothetical protein